MKSIFICIFAMYSGILFSQVYSLGNQSKWNDLKHPVSCDLQLLKGNRYCITLTVMLTDDIVHGLYISYGSFSKKGALYHLEDIPSGAEIILEEVKHSNMFVKRGFYFMENEYFFKDGDATDSDIVNFEKEQKRKSEQETAFLMNKSLDSISLQVGTYSNRNISLSLEVDYCYKVHFLIGKEFSYLVSKGKWSKKGNELKLYDPCLNYTFRVLINPNKLTMISFPNDLLMDKNYDLIKEE